MKVENLYERKNCFMATAITNVTSVLTAVTGVITGSDILMTMFAGGLFVVGAKVFKRIKNSVK